jgi:Swt1-like HEPN
VAVNQQLREDLLKTMGGVTRRRLDQVASARAQELLITHEQAVNVVAYEYGLKLSKYLTEEEQAAMRTIISQRPASPASPAPVSNGAPRKVAPKRVVVTIAGINVDKLDLPGLSHAHAREARAMASVYAALYLFENSLRDVIERVLKAKYGKDWWTTAVPGGVQETARKHKADEKKDPWHGRRGSREIDYVFLNELWAIVKHRWSDFKPLFPQGQAWLQSLIENDMNVSRRVVAHMNPLAKDDLSNVEAAFRKWTKHLEGVTDLLP